MSEALLEEYRRLWQVFRDGGWHVGPDVPTRQVCFDIQRVEDELKAAGVADPFGLVRTDHDALAFITGGRTLDESIEFNGGMAELEPEPVLEDLVAENAALKSRVAELEAKQSAQLSLF